jgi:hypothetical protein
MAVREDVLEQQFFELLQQYCLPDDLHPSARRPLPSGVGSVNSMNVSPRSMPMRWMESSGRQCPIFGRRWMENSSG